VTLKNAVISAVALWLGFVATTLAVNYSFGRRPLKLFAIDAGHWLAVFVVQGIVIGAMGV
jgi:1,4-dihydroxy-2-naphthoate octaprenyltransferase